MTYLGFPSGKESKNPLYHKNVVESLPYVGYEVVSTESEMHSILNEEMTYTIVNISKSLLAKQLRVLQACREITYC